MYELRYWQPGRAATEHECGNRQQRQQSDQRHDVEWMTTVVA
jgi:hypothetical protein